ncbi:MULTISPECIES: hypothetical protein [unclassified Streptomyces]|uniref:hypothetical protein n=1 Tax=unclassified Streptomyces TaxID=2593676 RepID=UPI00278C293A|nr:MULTISPECIES: hypothetical protein [unclassified Streptomyces]
MELEGLLAAIGQLQELVRGQGIVSGEIPHVLAQLQQFVQARIDGQEARLEERIRITITENRGLIIGHITETTRELQRVVDNANLTLAANAETKTTQFANRLFDQQQVMRDVIVNAVGGRTSTVQAETVQLTPDVVTRIEGQLTALYRRMIDERFSPMLLKEGFERLRFQDTMGQIFEPAIRWLFTPDGPIAMVALQAASHSPDFHPAMEALFGPTGKVADAATQAAGGVNLAPAVESLEEKVEKGVTGALDKAGTAAAEHGAKALGEKVSAGANALGTALTAIPQLYGSVTALGEAWNKPLKSTKDYMDLLAAAGGVVSQAGQVLQAFSGITQIAAAAQAVFNAVMAMNPVVLVVIAVVALIAAITLLIVYWDQVKAALRDNPWLAVAASLLGIIGIIVVIIAYWDEIKLAVLRAANFISVQAQRIGLFFVGVGTVIGQVWDVITASVANVGISILNAFISAGVAIQNFFIGVINWVLEQYNKLADSVIGDLVGLDRAELVPEVPVETKLIPPREVPTIDVNAAFASGQVTGGLETQIAAQEKVVAQAQQEDEKRRAGAAAPPPAAAPAAPAVSAAPAGLPALPAAGARPELPTGAAAAAPAGSVDQSVHVEGGITVNVNAERLEADSAALLSDDIIAQLQQRLGALRSEQDFRTGARPTA